ncbi:MAG TPA: hypothetical protein PK957_03750 [Candidatus Dojkabacteria bacterium]|nr:hypothetical protein [Candidatus Dojkabacteria bacterium]HQF36935.1 hypothetical protein [Candidatus Dojkabacteria bacterium]
MDDTANNTVQKLKLLINNTGAPQMVKDSLLQEIDQKGATPEVMDRVIQSFETEKDILVLTINSVTNLKKQVTEGGSTEPTQLTTPPPLVNPTPQPIYSNPSQLLQPQMTTPTTPTPSSDEVKKKQEELEKLLEELKALQAESPTDNKTNVATPVQPTF